MILNKKSKKLKVVFLANTGWYLYNFRLSLINFLIKKGFDIHLICPYDAYTKKIIDKGIIVHKWDLKSSSTNIFKEINSIISLYKIYQNIKPDIVHHFTIKSVLYGTLISNFCGIKIVFNSITGLGRIFLSKNLKDKFLNFLVIPIYKFIIKKSNSSLIFQNKWDLSYFKKINIATKNNSFLIRGSGINTRFFKDKTTTKSFPKRKYWKLLFPARLIREKGINELITACDKLWEKNKNFRLFIAGEYNLNQRGNLSRNHIEKIREREYIVGIKYQSNMKNIYMNSDIVILPTWREGLSRALLEAGCMELPIITTNVPGCKDIVLNKKTGLLVNKKDPESIKNAIIYLMKNEKLCKKFGANARLYIEKNFTNDIINNQTYELYKKIISKNIKLENQIIKKNIKTYKEIDKYQKFYKKILMNKIKIKEQK